MPWYRTPVRTVRSTVRGLPGQGAQITEPDLSPGTTDFLCSYSPDGLTALVMTLEPMQTDATRVAVQEGDVDQTIRERWKIRGEDGTDRG